VKAAFDHSPWSARGLAGSYAVAFFLGELGGDGGGLTFVAGAHPDGIAVPATK
jgi:hypothetical protein